MLCWSSLFFDYRFLLLLSLDWGKKREVLPFPFLPYSFILGKTSSFRNFDRLPGWLKGRMKKVLYIQVVNVNQRQRHTKSPKRQNRRPIDSLSSLWTTFYPNRIELFFVDSPQLKGGERWENYNLLTKRGEIFFPQLEQF